ncbi:MAG: hypothetical protein RBS68_15650 [Anaerolineales bacterium]|nr:hypothetical protein [Anaerolineales bacterium]
MKLRIFLPLFLAMLACSAPGLGPRPTIEPLIFPTALALETVTPISPPGMFETVSPVASSQALPPTLAPGSPQAASSTPTLDVATATLSADPLSEIKISTGQIYYGGDCSPKEVTFTVSASQPEKIYSVLLFVRLRNQKSGATSAWNTGLAMRPLGSGRFEYKLRAANVPSYKEYDPAWLQYQFVLTDTRGEVVARSQVFLDQIKFQRVCP